MHNNVVSGIYKALIRENISCLRFNFRAVGRSTGNHTEGSGEASDVRACVDFLLSIKKTKKVLLCGYSYGAAIGCSQVNYSDSIVGFCAISFPFDFMGVEYKKLSQSEKPKLFIQGNRDNIAMYDKFDSHFNFFYDPKLSVIMNGADHFYGGYESKIADEVVKFYYSLFE